MTSIMQNWPQLAPYFTTIVAVAVLTGAVLVQSFLAGILALAPGHQVSGMPLKGDHSDRSFRIMRTYANSTENLPTLLGGVLVALIAGASPIVVNALVVVHVGFRFAFWVVYYAGVGKVGGGVRTICYTLAMFANLILVLFALYSLLT